MQAQFRFNPGQIQDEKIALKSDDDSPANLNAVFGGGTKQILSNVIMVGAAGDVSVLFYDKTTPEVITGLAAGIWQSRKPFKHVYSTSTTATGIRVGYTF